MLVNDKNLMKSSHSGTYPNVNCLYSTIPRDIRMHMYRVSKYAQCFLEYLYEEKDGTELDSTEGSSPEMRAILRALPDKSVLKYSEQIF